MASEDESPNRHMPDVIVRAAVGEEEESRHRCEKGRAMCIPKEQDKNRQNTKTYERAEDQAAHCLVWIDLMDVPG